MQIFKPGDIVEGYRVMSELGRGAASVIYLVQDTKAKTIWAFKHVAREDAKDARFLDQASREYEVASKLQHPNIRRIERMIRIKSGLLSIGELMLVMELVDGQAVDRSPPRTFEQAADIFEQTARGLAYMHASGWVHADMKPNNIVVDDKGHVKIIDLGQSCPMNTVKKRIQGTPDYIAPEQVHRQPITHKTDIYNLGATIYWALTRHFVPTALAKPDSLVGSIDSSLIEKPKPPSELNTRIPEIFSDLIMQCVEVEPAMRPDTMNVVAERLNLIKAKLLAEVELRKSGSFRRVRDDDEAAKSGGRGKSGSAASGRVPHPSPPPPISAAGGIDDESVDLDPDELPNPAKPN